ncbi:hypothetical protein A0H76_1991 [Hepatospora eriocheir]|uniref:Uncharacterized protein n=1 Tax=Hepatospora eriocheir TaxID=1081669 RepID=A0A1X0QKI0_9MICR|nr:hypothetical protein A0H76_1991 [Hepatospora eriocheir]
MIYRRAIKLYKDYEKSNVLTKKIEDAQPEIKKFLENIYSYILTNELNFHESCYYFDIYFEVSGDKSDRKVMNTLLVIFKESTYYVDNSDIEEYMKYLDDCLFRFVNYVDNDIKKEGITHYFSCVRSVIDNVTTAKVLFKRSQRLRNSLKLESDVLVHYNSLLKNSKFGVFIDLIQRVDDIVSKDCDFIYFEPDDIQTISHLNSKFDQVNEKFEAFSSILTSSENRVCQEKILEYIKDEINKIKFDDKFDYLNIKIKGIRTCFGSRSSRLNKELDEYINSKKNKIIDDTVIELNGKMSNFNETDDECVQLLMNITKLLDLSSFETMKTILFRCKDNIVKFPVLVYFLHQFIKSSKPSLDNQQDKIVNRIRKQFKFLINHSL